MTDKLLPCPFCGDRMKISGTIIRHREKTNCVITLQAWDVSAIDDWNRRAPSPAPELASGSVGEVDPDCQRGLHRENGKDNRDPDSRERCVAHVEAIAPHVTPANLVRVTLPSLGDELYEHYAVMSAQTHEALVKDYARKAIAANVTNHGCKTDLHPEYVTPTGDA